MKLATSRGDAWLVRRKVLSSDGALVHDDHEAWLRLQLEQDGGDADKTYRRLKGEGYLLTRCEITNLYLVHDQGTSEQAGFVQVEVDVEDEYVDRKLLSDYLWSTPSDLRDLLNAEGDELQGDARRRFRPAAYNLRKVTDVAAFVEAAHALEVQRRESMRSKKLLVTDMDTGVEKLMSQDELAPGWDRFPVKAKRLFDDWARSSAGRSGARFCDNWVAQMSDYTDKDGERWMSLVPAWTFAQKLAQIEGHKGSAYELYGKLEKLDRRVKVPFAWFFYMLHGNRVDDTCGKRVLAAAEAGQIVLPEHDYQVLKAWRTHPYGF
ncbi:MAG: hypothetical protein ABI216_05840 [Devosia sp.]